MVPIPETIDKTCPGEDNVSSAAASNNSCDDASFVLIDTNSHGGTHCEVESTSIGKMVALLSYSGLEGASAC